MGKMELIVNHVKFLVVNYVLMTFIHVLNVMENISIIISVMILVDYVISFVYIFINAIYIS